MHFGISKPVVVFAMLFWAAHAQAREPVATTEQFAFYSDFETNVNDALIAAGVARKSGRTELFSAGDEQACFEALAPSSQTGWNLAVDFYAEIISPHQFNDRQQSRIRLSLAGIEEEDARALDFLDQAANFRRAASPAYKACRWTAQDAANRLWIDNVTSQMLRHEPEISARLAKLYQQTWPDQHMDVDVVATVSWAGANSYFPDNSAGHILISSGSAGHEALETVFHEASHGFMLRPAPLQDALALAAEQVGVPVPDGLWHVVLFYTTGEAVRTVLEDAGEPGYKPMIYEIYGRSSWGDYQEAMDATWPSYMDGRKSATDAALDLTRQISGQ